MCRPSAIELIGRGAVVEFVDVPDRSDATKWGVDDWLAAQGKEPVINGLTEGRAFALNLDNILAPLAELPEEADPSELHAALTSVARLAATFDRVTREFVREHFSDLLKGLRFDDEVLGWLSDSLQSTQAENNREHEQAINRLSDEHARLQNRIDAMYVDKLDGRVETSFFDRMSAEWRAEQGRLLRSIREHESASTAFEVDGVRLLELSKRAHELFEKQQPSEKRRFLSFVFSNCSWKGGQLQANYKQLFDLLAVTAAKHETAKAAGLQPNGLSEIWLLR